MTMIGRTILNREYDDNRVRMTRHKLQARIGASCNVLTVCVIGCQHNSEISVYITNRISTVYTVYGKKESHIFSVSSLCSSQNNF